VPIHKELRYLTFLSYHLQKQPTLF